MSNNQNGVLAKIATVSYLLGMPLNIPGYQRPYMWQGKNVRQLFDDILTAKQTNRKNYRIGSVILHNNNEKLDIVDGQQRITTICLYLHLLGQEFPELKYLHRDSYENIRNNKIVIKDWIAINLLTQDDKKQFTEYILEYCNFIEIQVSSESEAFQMFDSQNGRGKELEAYNLLKAYHIRAMESDSQTTKIECDRRWESATVHPKGSDILKQLFDEQIYRTRIWSGNEIAWWFSKKEIDEFKGLTISKNSPISFPYQNGLLRTYLTSKFYESILSDTTHTKPRFTTCEPGNINPFVNLCQPIINGKPFFDFIETYVEIYTRLFIELDSSQLKEFKEFYKKHCEGYAGYTRTGDKYLKEVYKSLIFSIFDKFGEEAINKFYKLLYIIVYKNRLDKQQVKYSFVASIPTKCFVIIRKAKDLNELSELYKLKPKYDPNSIKKNVSEIKALFDEFYNVKELQQ